MSDDDKRFQGTCQACLRQQIVKPKARSKDPVLVLHGYRRPGTGETVGRCAGEGHLPFELSCEFTKHWKGKLEAWLVNERQYLADLNAGRVTSLYIDVADPTRKREWGGKRPTKSIAISPGWKGEYGSGYCQSWEAAVETKKHATKTQISGLESDIKVLGGRTATWIYSPEKLGRLPEPQVSQVAEGRAWYYSEATQKLLRSLPAPAGANRPGATLLAWLEHQRPMMMFTTIRGATKPSYFDYVRRQLASSQGLPPPPPTARRGAKPAKPLPPPKPVSKKQAELLADLVNKGGEHVYQDVDMSTYYTACDLKGRNMATWDFLNEPSFGGERQPRLVKVTITDQGREGLSRYQAGDTMGARMAARKALRG
jgi:hypothetical protein